MFFLCSHLFFPTQRSVVRTVLGHPDWRKAMRTTFTTRDGHGERVPETPLRYHLHKTQLPHNNYGFFKKK